MSRIIKKGATSQSLYFDVFDSTSSTGGRKTGLAYNTSSLIAYYTRNGAAATQITLATLAAASSAWSSGGFKEVDATNDPGLYRLDVPDAAFASGAESVVVSILGATGMVKSSEIVQLVAIDLQDAVRMGMTALPNAAAEAAGGLFTRGTGAGQINQDANGRVDANAKAWASTTTTLTSGLPDVNMKTITAGIIAAASFAANALDAVWSTATRVLTAGTNIALAKGTGVTGFNDLDAAGVRSAVGLASANLDTQLSTIAGYIDTEVAAIKAKTDNLPSDPADASDIAASFSTVNATLATIAGYVDTEVAAIKAKTDSLTFTVAGQVDVNVIDWKGAAAPAMTGDAFARLGAPAGLTVSADIATIAGYVDTEVAAIKAKTDNLPSDPADASDIAAALASLQSHGDGAWATAAGFLDAAGVRAAVGLASANLDTQLDALPTNADLATALAGADDATLAAIAGLNNLSAAQVKTQADQALTDAGVTTTVTGRIDAAISSRLASGSYTAPDNTGIAAVKAKTDNLPSDPADQSLVIAAADAVMARLGAPSGVSVSADIAAVKADSAAVKTKTDSLAFTVAGKVDANITHVNETAVNGTGASGDPWGP